MLNITLLKLKELNTKDVGILLCRYYTLMNKQKRYKNL